MEEPPTVEELRRRLSSFGIYDYLVFAGALATCTLFGIYFASRRKKEADDASEYLTGGKNMSVFPVASSLIASSVSGIVLLGVPSEIYLYGTEYAFACLAIPLTGLISSYLVLPVFHGLQLVSVYGYLEIRFDRNVRLFGSLMFAVSQICCLLAVVHVPALTLNQGINTQIVTPCVCLIRILYTCLGGLKAVVWADVLSVWCTIGSVILVGIKGSLDVGGVQEVWKRNYEGGRLVAPTFEMDLTIRHTFWGLCFGSLVMQVQESILNQNVLQRYLSLTSVSHARRALWIVVFGTTGLILLSCYVGLVIYALYHDCDPLTTRLSKSKDQLLPLVVMRTAGHLPGLPALFVAGIFSASLSSLSTGLISMSAVVLEDFIKPFLDKESGGRAAGFIVRGAVIIFGALILFLIFSVDKLGTALQLIMSLGSMTSGPAFGVFFSGIFLPWVNAKGALFGGLLGLFGSSLLTIGAQNAAAGNKLRFLSKPASVEGCLYYYNATILGSASEIQNGAGNVFPLFKLSYLWHTAFGGFTTIFLALIVSAASGFSDFKTLDPNWFSPAIRNWLPASRPRTPKYTFLLRQTRK